jgi:hypothetical protein
MRQALTIILPLLAPTFLYIYLKTRSGTPIRVAAGDAPWVWLGAAGVGLAAILLTTLALTSGGPTDSTYRPARFEDGRVVPGDVVPRKDAERPADGAAKP